MLYRERGFNDRGCCLSPSIPQAHGIASLGPFYLLFSFYLTSVYHICLIFLSLQKNICLLLKMFF